MIDALDIGYAIKDRRMQLGLTQSQVAEAANVSKRCLWSLELGQNPGVQLNKLTAVLDALDLDLNIAPANNTNKTANTAQTTTSQESQKTKAPSHASKIPNGKTDAPFDALAILTGATK